MLTLYEEQKKKK